VFLVTFLTLSILFSFATSPSVHLSCLSLACFSGLAGSSMYMSLDSPLSSRKDASLLHAMGTFKTMSAARLYRYRSITPRPIGMRVLHSVRMIAPNGIKLTSGVLIQARLYIHRHSGISTSARTVEEMVIMIL
ncbi:hypothetical protein DPEC_G00340670, partial [Dallia pectoralis]